MGKIIVIEGTDCSGKETQTNALMASLKAEGFKVEKMSFPNYDSPSGKIVGGPYLGKSEICEGYFSEGSPNVDAKVSCLYYAADRRYNLNALLKAKEENDYLILDRYVYSSMAHQGGKIYDEKERKKIFDYISELEFNLLELPVPDIVILLYMPYEYATILKGNRTSLDQNEKDQNHLINAETTYIEIADLYKFNKVDCVKDGSIRTIEDISKEVLSIVTKK